jgi:exopolysaccharide biosynthesis polyprenyl glycosylphosphotransferase
MTLLFSRPELEFLWQKRWPRALAALFDAVALYVAWHATVDLRLLLNPFMGLKLSRLNLTSHAPSAAAVLLVWAGLSFWRGLYGSKTRQQGGYLANLTNATAQLSALLISYGFFTREIGVTDTSRSFVLLFAPLSFLMLLAANYAVLSTCLAIGRRFRFEERLAIAGDGPQADLLVEQLAQSGGPMRMVGVILPNSGGSRVPAQRVPVLGTTATIAEVINRAKLDRIILADHSLPEEEAATCARVARRMGIVTGHALTGVFDESIDEAFLRVRNGLAIVEMRRRPFTRKQQIIKRAFDVLVSATLLILLLPLLILLAVIIRLTSPGPALYSSDRVGKGGRHFRFYKFRTMVQDAEAIRQHAGANEQNGHLFKIRKDRRVTPIGRFMRRFSLDELPQLANVLIGDMSLVGPRPLPARDLEPDGCSRHFATWAGERAETMPGITCLWQIRGRSDLPFEKMIELDLQYVRNWSLALDLEILLETPLAVLSGRGAY